MGRELKNLQDLKGFLAVIVVQAAYFIAVILNDDLLR